MLTLLLALMLDGPGRMQELPVPPVCIGPTFVSWQACADAAQPGSPAYSLAMINLGTEAYMRGDQCAAVDYYDRGELPGHEVTSDVWFHTFRGDARRYVGRAEEASVDARIAWNYLLGQPPAGTPRENLRGLTEEEQAFILSLLLPILKEDDPEVLRRARTMYLALPATDWTLLSLKAGALTSLGEHDAAISASEAALNLRPDHPLSQNNHCYVLAEAGRAADAMPYCERALAALPAEGSVRHSYATALAGIGDCEAAEREMEEARRLQPASAASAKPLACTPAAP